MKAYVAQVAESELRQFVAEDAVPEDILAQLIREWSLPEMTAVWAVLGDEDAEAVREELAAGRQTRCLRRAPRPCRRSPANHARCPGFVS